MGDNGILPPPDAMDSILREGAARPTTLEDTQGQPSELPSDEPNDLDKQKVTPRIQTSGGRLALSGSGWAKKQARTNTTYQQTDPVFND